MGQFEQDGVQFNIEPGIISGKETIKEISGKLFSGGGIIGWELEDGETPSKLINAVEID